MRRAIITWSVVLVVIVGAFVGTVVILNASLYSAGGFVRNYLDALARHDAAGALELVAPNTVPSDASRELLVPTAMSKLGDIKLVSDTVDVRGMHTVLYSFEADGVAGQSSFTVQRRGTLLGLFNTWTFADNPLGTIKLTVSHGDDFTANGVDLVTPSQNAASPYLVFTPGRYTLSHDSTYLHASPVTVSALVPGKTIAGTLDIEATSALAKMVSTQLTTFLDDCARQPVLLPSGCPFGQPISNRIVTIPAWRISAYPQVTLVAGTGRSEWVMPTTPAAAHLVVDIRSLFDGSVTTFDQDVPFQISITITIKPDGSLTIVPKAE